MGGQAGLSRLRGNGSGDHGGAVAVARVVLHDEHRPHAPLLAAHHGTEVGIKNVAPLYACFPRLLTLRRKIAPALQLPRGLCNAAL